MRTVWNMEDIKAGARIKKPLTDGSFEHFIVGVYYFGISDPVWGIFNILSGEFIRVGSGIKEAVLIHLNNCGFKPCNESKD